MSQHRPITRRPITLGALALATLATSVLAAASPSSPGALSPAAHAAPASAAERVGTLDLLTDPFLQAPGATEVSVAWMTEYRGTAHAVLVGEGVGELSEQQLRAAAAGQAPAGVRLVAAGSSRLSRVAEDAASQLPVEVRPTAEQGIVEREVHRHEAVVTGLRSGERTPYRVVSTDGDAFVASGTFTLAPVAAPGQGQQILLTSDHQAMVNTPANLQLAKETLGDIDAVFLAGDLVNIPDRASEWFDDQRGSAFFPVLQGRGGRVSTGGRTYVGGEIVQHAPLFPAVGNHEVQGRRDGQTSLSTSYNAPIPRDVAERAYERRAAEVNPSGDPAVRERWIEDNSFSSRTYEEIFNLPDDSPGGETYYATTVGDVRLVSLYSTRIWRGTNANADPAQRTANSRYQEAQANLGDPLKQGYGEHVFEGVDAGSPQLEWLEEELASEEFQNAPIKVVMLHEGPQGLGDNVMPVFAHPERIESRDASGALTSVRYEYRTKDNMLVRDLQPMLEEAGADLVLNGHSHLWNRFRSENRTTNWMETSNTGNTYGAYHGLSGRTRPVPPAPWDASNYLPIGNPGGLAPITPTVRPQRNPDGVALPFVQSNDLAVFAMLDTEAREVVSYVYDVKDPDTPPHVFDRYSLGDAVAEVSASAETTTFGQRPVVRVEVGARRGADAVAATGRVELLQGGRVLASAAVRDGAARLSPAAGALAPGWNRLTVRYAGSGSVAAADAAVSVGVRTARPAVRARLLTSPRVRREALVRVGVDTASGPVAGRVEVRRGTVVVGRGWLSQGRATLRISPSAFPRAGATSLRVVYAGTRGVAPAATSVAARVR